MKKLQKREKALLVVLAVLVGVACIQFVLVPAIRQMFERSEQLATYAAQEEALRSRLSTLSTLEERLTAYQAEADALYGMLSSAKSYDVSLLLSEMMQKHGLSPEGFSISKNLAPRLTPPPVEPEEGEAAEEPKSETVYVTMKTAQVSFYDPADNALRFLDELAAYSPSVIVSGFNEEAQLDGKTLYTLTLDFYEFIMPDFAAAQTGGENNEQ